MVRRVQVLPSVEVAAVFAPTAQYREALDTMSANVDPGRSVAMIVGTIAVPGNPLA